MSSSRLTIRKSDDGLSAFVSVSRGAALAPSDLNEALQDAGVLVGLEAGTIQQLAQSLSDTEFACDEWLIAQGHAARAGSDAWLELAFSEGIQAGHLREDGSIDYHERDLLKPVIRGDVLGMVHPELPGIAGVRVDGTRLALPTTRGLTIDLRSGVELGADGRVRAQRDGVIQYKPHEFIDVTEHHVHPGAVDLHSGNLRMQGSLTVKGDVKRPFSVVATGDLEIFGNIEAAVVRSEGKLKVHGAVQGGQDSTVCAESDLTASHAESAELRSGGQLRIREAINCQLSAAAIHASGKLRGGHAVAETEVIVKEVGTVSGIDTHLTAGEPLSLPVAEAQRVIAVLRSERMAQRAGGRNNDRNKGGKLGRVRSELDQAELRRLAERSRRREELQTTAFIHVGVAHAGVTLHIGQAMLCIDGRTTATRYSFDPESTSIRGEKAGL